MTRRFVSMVLVMILVLLLPAALAEDNTPDSRAGYYYVRTENGKGLNVRNGPNGEKIGSIKYGTRIYVYTFTTPEWALINYKYDNGYGLGEYAAWVSTRYLTRNNPGKYEAAAAVPVQTVQTVSSTSGLESINAIFRTAVQVPAPYSVISRPSRASGWVNLRWAPSTDAERIATCPQGKRLTVLAELNGWFQVQDPATGMIGFIRSKYVQRQ